MILVQLNNSSWGERGKKIAWKYFFITIHRYKNLANEVLEFRRVKNILEMCFEIHFSGKVFEHEWES